MEKPEFRWSPNYEWLKAGIGERAQGGWKQHHLQALRMPAPDREGLGVSSMAKHGPRGIVLDNFSPIINHRRLIKAIYPILC